MNTVTTSSSAPVRIAMIGAGGINQAHRVAFEKHPERVRLVGVADPLVENARSLAEPFGTVAGDDPARLLDELRGRVDAVLVTTPHYLHRTHAGLAMERGLPVLIEKPVACTVAEIRELQELERRHGVFAQAGQMQRFGREENWLKRWLASEEFGEARLFNLDIYQNIEGYVSGKPNHWILDGRKAGGGVVMSVAVHILDLLRYWFDDDFVEVSAYGRFDPPMHGGAESVCTAILRSRRGLVGTLNCSYTVARCHYSQRSLLFGTRGTLAQHLEKIGGGYAGPYYLSSDGGLPSPKWEMMYSGFQSVAERMQTELGAEEAIPNASFVRQMLAFADNVRDGRPGENSLARNLNTIATVEAIGRAILSGAREGVDVS